MFVVGVRGPENDGGVAEYIVQCIHVARQYHFSVPGEFDAWNSIGSREKFEFDKIIRVGLNGIDVPPKGIADDLAYRRRAAQGENPASREHMEHQFDSGGIRCGVAEIVQAYPEFGFFPRPETV